MSFCIGGFCIPYSALLPVLLILFRPLYEWVCKVMGIDINKPSKKGGKGDSDSIEAKDGSKPCCASGSAPVAPESPFYLGPDTPSWKALVAASAEKPLIVRFTATWCGPCKKVEPLFNALAQARRGQATFVSVDVDDFPEIMDEQQLLGVPYFLSFKNGALVTKYRGSDEQEVEKIVSSALAL